MSFIIWFFALSGLCYLLNIGQIIFGESRGIYTSIFKVIGIFIFPLGVIMGLIGLFD
jgi:hypothetical protein